MDAAPGLLTLKSKAEIEREIAARVSEERKRLASRRPEATRSHFHRPVERPFTAAERNTVTILYGGLTWKHEWLIRSVFQAAGYKVELMPTPDVAGFQLGKEYGNNGQCNPTYFMTGHLIKYLQGLEAQGMSRQEIVDNYCGELRPPRRPSDGSPPPSLTHRHGAGRAREVTHGCATARRHRCRIDHGEGGGGRRRRRPEHGDHPR